MARPRTYVEARVATAVRLPESVHRRLHEAAVDRDVSANLLITRAVTEFLDRLTPAEAALTSSAQTVGPLAAEVEA
jgi:predicted transcriptional regulator